MLVEGYLDATGVQDVGYDTATTVRAVLDWKNGKIPPPLIVDPGFGFGWTSAQSLEMLRRLGELRDLGLPLLIGTSRKSPIGAVLDDAPPDTIVVQPESRGTAPASPLVLLPSDHYVSDDDAFMARVEGALEAARARPFRRIASAASGSARKYRAFSSSSSGEP